MLIRPLFVLCSAVLVLSAISVSAQDETPAKEEAPKLETTKDKASYAIGFNIGRDLKRQGLDLDPKIIAEGIAASIAGKEGRCGLNVRPFRGNSFRESAPPKSDAPCLQVEGRAAL